MVLILRVNLHSRSFMLAVNTAEYEPIRPSGCYLSISSSQTGPFNPVEVDPVNCTLEL